MPMKNLKPLVSIITPTLNRGNFLEKTIQSVVDQDYENIEHIVIDGGSPDNTVEILKKYEGKYNLRWISEKDKGYADACNKGLKMAKGEIIGLCHSDDFYTEGTIKKVVKTFLENPAIDLVLGVEQEFNYETNQFSEPYLYDSQEVESITPEDIFEGEKYLHQPSLFYRRRIIEKTGLLNINFEFVSVIDWYNRMFKNGARILYLDDILAITGQHPEKGSIKYAAQGIKETMDFMKSHGRHIPLSLKLSYFRWKYPKIPNFLKSHFPSFFSLLKNIIKKI